jgi:putative lipoprotein (rSAM/lipoprotein system)
MKRMSQSLTKGANWILSGILSILGFSGCTENYGMDEYGTPYATFSFHGIVTNKAGPPVKDIKIEAVQPGEERAGSLALTNEAGKYSMTFEHFPVDNFQVIASDIDGEANGSYRNDTIPVKITKDDYYDQGKGWNRGSASKEVTIVLKEKESSPASQF